MSYFNAKMHYVRFRRGGRSQRSSRPSSCICKILLLRQEREREGVKGDGREGKKQGRKKEKGRKREKKPEREEKTKGQPRAKNSNFALQIIQGGPKHGTKFMPP